MQNDKEQHVPDWIRANSDVWSQRCSEEGEDGNDDADAAFAVERAPVCRNDDAPSTEQRPEHFLRAINYWCIPLAVGILECRWFADTWFRLPVEERAATVEATQSGMFYAKPLLDATTELEMVALLDDPKLFAALFDPCATGVFITIVRLDAVQCVASLPGGRGRGIAVAHSAAEYGSVKVFRFAVAPMPKDFPNRQILEEVAIRNGQTSILAEMFQNWDRVDIWSCFMTAAQYGHWSVIEWCRQKVSTALFIWFNLAGVFAHAIRHSRLADGTLNPVMKEFMKMWTEEQRPRIPISHESIALNNLADVLFCARECGHPSCHYLERLLAKRTREMERAQRRPIFEMKDLRRRGLQAYKVAKDERRRKEKASSSSAAAALGAV